MTAAELHALTMADFDRQFESALAAAGRTYGGPKQEGGDNRLQPAHGLARRAGRPKADDFFRRGNGCSLSGAIA